MVDLSDRNTQLAIAVPVMGVGIFAVYWFLLRKKGAGVTMTVSPRDVNACQPPCSQTITVKGPANATGSLGIYVGGQSLTPFPFVTGPTGIWTETIVWGLNAPQPPDVWVPPTQDEVATLMYVATIGGGSATVTGTITIKAGQQAPCTCS